MFMHGIEELDIRADILANPDENDELKRLNVILANPPYSIKSWDQKAFNRIPIMKYLGHTTTRLRWLRFSTDIQQFRY